MINKNIPESLEELETLLNTYNLVYCNDIRNLLFKKMKKDDNLHGASGYLLIDENSKEIEKIFHSTDLERAILHLFFSSQWHLETIKEPSYDVTLLEVYEHLGRQQVNPEGECPVCGTRDLLEHDVHKHWEHLRTTPPCQHHYVRKDGMNVPYCSKCFLVPVQGLSVQKGR